MTGKGWVGSRPSAYHWAKGRHFTGFAKIGGCSDFGRLGAGSSRGNTQLPNGAQFVLPSVAPTLPYITRPKQYTDVLKRHILG